MDDYPDGFFGGPGSIEPWARPVDDGAGGVSIYYSRDRNFKDNTLPAEFTLSVRNFDGATMTTRTDLNTSGLGLDPANFAVITTGASDPAGDDHLIFFVEDRFSRGIGGGPSSGLAARFRRWPKMQAGGTFSPMDFTPTHTIDTGFDTDARIFGGTPKGATADVAIYIEQGGHLYYNEYSSKSDTWKDAAEYIVDNDSSADAIGPTVTSFRTFDPPELQTDGEMARAITWWLRFDRDGDLRLHARVHK